MRLFADMLQQTHLYYKQY